MAMRPTSKLADFPSAHNVGMYIHNTFVVALEKLKTEIENAPGKVSCTANRWTADQTKMGYLGMTAHWINISKSGKWTLHSEVVGFRLLHGARTGVNIGRYFVGLCDRVGIMLHTHSKLYTLTLDKTSANDTSCENQLPCLEHVCNLANINVMGHITKIKAIDTTSTIWDYSPSDLNNRVLDGRIDVIATIRTLSIKAINLFVVQADQLYGPIMTQHINGRITKKIPWTDFSLNNANWEHVKDAMDILADSNRVLHYFSAEKQPTLCCALPTLENLQLAWEDKFKKLRYSLYHAAIRDGLAKLIKYYTQFDEKPVYILALFLHLHFKLHYIKIAWGGPEEQQIEINQGNFDTKDWVQEARIIVENTMEKYWLTQPTHVVAASKTILPDIDIKDLESFTSEFDKHCCTLLSQNVDDEWQAELQCYLKDVPEDMTSETNIIAWWLDHVKIYPTLARITIDVLPCQTSSVPCEQVFSSARLTTTDHCVRLGTELLKKLQIIKHIWHPELVNYACANSEDVDIVTLSEFKQVLSAELELLEWERDLPVLS
ncbi:hypothetical protein DXG01_016564 [Tephrocybe rancida]|nr:hypothetical protein DXG01_016564 [Tephrocybe rancida]